MTPTGVVGDVILAGALVAIVGLEVRRQRRLARARHERALAIREAQRAQRAAYGYRRARDREAGQALAEFAIVVAIALPLALAAMQVGMLVSYHLAQQNATVTLAGVAAYNGPGAEFSDAVDSEAARIDCEAPRVTVESTDGIVKVSLDCTWRAPFYRDASWPVTTSASAAATPEPTPEPTDEPSPEPSPEGAA